MYLPRRDPDVVRCIAAQRCMGAVCSRLTRLCFLHRCCLRMHAQLVVDRQRAVRVLVPREHGGAQPAFHRGRGRLRGAEAASSGACALRRAPSARGLPTAAARSPVTLPGRPRNVVQRSAELCRYGPELQLRILRVDRSPHGSLFSTEGLRAPVF